MIPVKREDGDSMAVSRRGEARPSPVSATNRGSGGIGPPSRSRVVSSVAGHSQAPTRKDHAKTSRQFDPVIKSEGGTVSFLFSLGFNK